jgi:hypothetical protein
LVDVSVSVVISILRVEESGQSEEGLTQRVNISLGLVTLDLVVAVGDLSKPFRGDEGVETVDDG